MYNNSIPLFRLDGKPALGVVVRRDENVDRVKLVVQDNDDPPWVQGVDFSISSVYRDRLERAVTAFNAAMQDDDPAFHEAAARAIGGK